MKKTNICKFVTSSTPETLSIVNFIFETETKVMRNCTVLENNRAYLVTEGQADVLIEGKRYEVCTGTLFFGFDQESFVVEKSEKFMYLYICFEGSRADVLFRRFGIDKNNRCFGGFDGLIPLWFDSLSVASSENVDLAAESVLLYSFSRMAKTATKQNSLINTIYQITDEHFTSPDLTLTYIAETLSYNLKYLSHFFKEKTGISYCEYLRNLRIKYAVSLFEHGIDSVKNVAFLSGFSDPLYFSRVFKTVVGVSPAEYKRKS